MCKGRGRVTIEPWARETLLRALEGARHDPDQSGLRNEADRGSSLSRHPPGELATNADHCCLKHGSSLACA